MEPPWAKRISRQMARPSPVPSCLCVTMGSKRVGRYSSGIAGPLSRTVTEMPPFSGAGRQCRRHRPPAWLPWHCAADCKKPGASVSGRWKPAEVLRRSAAEAGSRCRPEAFLPRRPFPAEIPENSRALERSWRHCCSGIFSSSSCRRSCRFSWICL